MKNNSIYYFVEGENEKTLVKTLKNKYIIAGKIKIHNVINKKISNFILRDISHNSIIILIFDTDIKNDDILKENVKILNKCSKEIIFIKQVYCLEDELVYSTDIKKIENLLNSKSKKDFKSDFNNCSNLLFKLENKNFKIDLLWSREDGYFKAYKNESRKIKK